MTLSDELIALRGLVEVQQSALKSAEGFISQVHDKNGFGEFTLKDVRSAIQKFEEYKNGKNQAG